MESKREFPQVLLVSVFVPLLLLFGASQCHALNLDELRCNGPVVQFEELSELFDVRTGAGTTIEWETTASCGENANYTSGTGNAACVKAGNSFDTSLETNKFSLAGATSAVLYFRLNYQDSTAGTNDRLDVDVSTNSGSSWTNTNTYDFDVPNAGGFRVVGSGPLVAVPLNGYLGQSSVEVRLRYYDAGAAPDTGLYVQVDDMSLVCVGGAQMRTDIGFSKPSVLEGENITYTLRYYNDGPKPATDAIGAGTTPPAFAILGAVFSQGGPSPTPIGENSIGATFGGINVGNSASISVTAKAGMYPEVSFDVLEPSSVAGNYKAYGATFGPAIAPLQTLTSSVVLANDSTGTTSDACEALTNGPEVAGKIVLVENSGCEFDEKVKRIQDAGGIAAIIKGDPSVIPFPYPISPFYLELISNLRIMRPSGNVVTPITIPSVLVSEETGTIILNNLVNSIQVKLTGVEVLAQEARITSFTAANEFDPDFGQLFPGIIVATNSNNITSNGVIVLKDSDKDGIADSEELCGKDPLKTVPGICGCGISETDTNANSIVDCLSGDELKFSIQNATGLVKQLRRVKLTGNKKKDKARKAKLAQVKTDLSSSFARISELIANQVIPVVTTSASVDLPQLAETAKKFTERAFRTNASAFLKNKRKAGRALSKLSAGIA